LGAEGTVSPPVLLADKDNRFALHDCLGRFKQLTKSVVQLNVRSLTIAMTWKVFDCAEHNPDCSARNQTVPANPDIAGIGVR
jgi:hypothetical protein